MSRPALYLRYKNKEDIFRSLAEFYFDDAVANVSAALSQPGPFDTVLADSFDAMGGAKAEAMLSSPHGRELLDAGNTTSPDIAEAGNLRLHGLYRDWLQAGVDAGNVQLGTAPEIAAQMILSALHGIKVNAPDYPSYLTQIAALAAMLGAGLTR